jgi:hypothetical protein
MAMTAYRGHIGENTLMELKRQALRARDHAERVVGQLDRTLEAGTEALEVGAAAFAFGVANGKVGGGGLRVPVIGAPADLAFGVGMHLVSFFSAMREEKARHYRAFANGALGSYFSTLGAQVGNAWRLKGPASGIKGLFEAISGDGGITGGGSLAEDELSRMVRPG